MNKIWVKIIFLTVCVPITAGQVVDPSELYFPCASCHGDNGQGSQPLHAPAIAGQSASYLLRQIANYRDGIRGSDKRDAYGQQMALMATIYRDSEWLELLTNYISEMPVATSALVREKNSENNTLYDSCVACHGVNGEGLESISSPRIGGLESVYLKSQLRNFRDGIRGSHREDMLGQQMRAAMFGLQSDAKIDEISDYIARLTGRSEERN